jgi:FdhD protein
MRTPGADFELAAGFLHGEQIVREADDIRRISYCVDRTVDEAQRYNIVNVVLRSGLVPDLAPLTRHFATTSACGVCGKATLEALHVHGCSPLPAGPTIATDALATLPETLRCAQGLFARTGGLHAAALFDLSGTLLCVREDVGRHNAVDKLVGWSLLSGPVPLSDHVLLVSGRTSYEIVQKALVAGIPIVCGVSAPSSLAVDLATRFGMTLIGFLRGSRFNLYAGAERIAFAPPPGT